MAGKTRWTQYTGRSIPCFRTVSHAAEIEIELMNQENQNLSLQHASIRSTLHFQVLRFLPLGLMTLCLLASQRMQIPAATAPNAKTPRPALQISWATTAKLPLPCSSRRIY